MPEASDIESARAEVLDFLYSISGRQTLSGQHNREPNSDPARWTQFIEAQTGGVPALWSGDFLFQRDNIEHRWTMIHEAERQWQQGAMVNLMLHTCPPDKGEPCGWDPGVINDLLSEVQWTELITAGSPLNAAWKERLDSVAVYLQYLQEQGEVVLFRPLHEMNQRRFWWGGRPGPDGTARLYQITHDYLTQEKNLANLIWVWDMQDLSRDFADYDPGPQYWDVFAFDVYDRGFAASWYEYILPIVGDRPMAIGECAALPSPQMLTEQPRWTFFMPWAELVESSNSPAAILRLYEDPRVITRDEMPGWSMRDGSLR